MGRNVFPIKLPCKLRFRARCHRRGSPVSLPLIPIFVKADISCGMRWGIAKGRYSLSPHLRRTTHTMEIFMKATRLKNRANQFGTYARAFTLAELLVVVAILVVASLISIPSLATLFQNNDLVQAENEISATMGQARAMAIEEHASVAVIFFEEPGNDSQTALAIESATPGQPGGVSSTVSFVADLGAPVSYLPKGTYVATIVGGLNNDGFAMPPNSSSNVNNPLRAIVFDPHGHVVILNSMVCAPPESLPNYPAYWDASDAYGPSSPALAVFQPGAWPTSVTSSTATEAAYVASHSDILMISTYTGQILN
jgi:prepilin-type N-terminal cleavage/methylation domain-containing protein